MLWDSSKIPTPRNPFGIDFELGPDYLDYNIKRIIYNHEMNHVLPFRESPSMGIVGLHMIRMTLIIPVRALVSFARRIGRDDYVPWRDWQHFATPIELPPTSTPPHILHSQVLSVCRARNPWSAPTLRVLDFSLRSRRRQPLGDPSAPLPPYIVRESPFYADCDISTFDFTEGGVLATSVRIHVIARHTNVLT